MRATSRAAFALAALAFVTAGCGSSFTFFKTNVGAGGARPLLPEASFEQVDLAHEVWPDGAPAKTDEPVEQTRERLRQAFAAFYDNVAEQPQRRNRVQERLLAASVQRCGQYKQFLKQLEGETNWFLGALTTAAAGAGAIVTGVDAARALAGVAAIFSGVRAEFNESFFQRLTIQVITDGLESKRRELYGQIQARQQQPISAYPLEAAIKDALEFHASCSLIAGLERAALSIERADNPGMAAAEKALVQAKRLQAINDGRLDDPLLLLGGPLRTSAVGVDPLSALLGTPRDAYASRVNHVTHRAQTLKRKLESLAAAGARLAKKQGEVELLKQVLTRDEQLAKGELERQFRDRVMTQDAKIRGIETDMLAATAPATRSGKYAELVRAAKEGEAIIADLDALYLTFQLGIVDAARSLDQTPDTDLGLDGARTRLLDLAAYLLGRRAERARAAVRALADGDAKLGKVRTALALADATTRTEVLTRVDAELGDTKVSAVRAWATKTWAEGTTFPGDAVTMLLGKIEEALK